METNARTLNAERVIAELVGLPLMRENVFHSARYLDVKTEKELCDLLLVHCGEAIVISIKAQEKSRDAAGTERWLGNVAGKAVAQLKGASTTLKQRSWWCEHRQRGRVTFQPGQLQPRHSVALLESRFECAIRTSNGKIPVRLESGPVTLMDVAGFLHITSYLRTWKDLLRYPDARATALCTGDARIVGAEPALFAYYTAMRDSFYECAGIADAKIVQAAGKHVREGSAFRDRERGLASILEDFIEQVSTAGPVELPEEVVELRARASATAADRDLLRDDLCDLSIQERAALGQQIGTLSGRVAERDREAAMLYAGVRFDRHPEKFFLIVVARGQDHAAASAAGIDALIAGSNYYQKTTGILLLANQMGPELRTTLTRMEGIARSVEMVARGEELFAHIRRRRVETAR